MDELVIGGMYSGKSAELIRKATECEFQSIKYKIFKHSVHTRDGNKVISRIGVERPCIMVDNAYQISQYAINNNLKYVLIDEVQFFGKEDILRTREVLNSNNITCCFYGLDRLAEADFTKNPIEPKYWETTKALIDSGNIRIVYPNQAYCDSCGRPACWTACTRSEANIVSSEEEASVYKASCKPCYRKIVLRTRVQSLQK